MLLTKFTLLLLIALQQFQSNLCQSSSRTQRSKTGIISHSVWNRQRTHKADYFSIRHASIFRCSGDRKKCGSLLIRKKVLMKERKRCCKFRQLSCEKHFYNLCKTSKCFKRKSRKCAKRMKRCNKRRIAGKRSINHCVWRRVLMGHIRRPPKTAIKKKIRDVCNRTEDCEPGLCCARHNHVKICKPLIKEGQVCTKTFLTRKRSPEMFERCPCASNLVCSPSKLRHNICQVPT